MSTNSGREGECERCGHSMNEHTSKSQSKCKNKACRKQWEICQGAVHGEDGGISHRICFKPCSCKEKYHPDKAKFALPLAAHEYKIGHPGYRPREEEEEDNEEEVLSPSPRAKHKPSASSSKHGTTSPDAKHRTPSKETSSKQTSSKQTSSKQTSSKQTSSKQTSSKPKSSSLSKQPKSPSSESSEDPLSCSERVMGEMPGIADGMAQMKITSTLPTVSAYGPVSTSSYNVSYTSANTLSHGSKASAPTPTDASATTSTSTPPQAARKVDITSYKANNEMCWAFELDGKTITSWADEWVEGMTKNKVPIMRYKEHNVYFYKTPKK